MDTNNDKPARAEGAIGKSGTLDTVAFQPDDDRAWHMLQECPAYRATPLLCMKGRASAVALMIRKYWPEQPRIVVVEPSAAHCLALSAKAGKLVDAQGPVSSMGRLDCTSASLLAFDALSVCDVQYLSVSDNEAAVAVESLDYLGLCTSPSGAAGFAPWQRERALDRSAGNHPCIIMSEVPV